MTTTTKIAIVLAAIAMFLSLFASWEAHANEQCIATELLRTRERVLDTRPPGAGQHSFNKAHLLCAIRGEPGDLIEVHYRGVYTSGMISYIGRSVSASNGIFMTRDPHVSWWHDHTPPADGQWVWKRKGGHNCSAASHHCDYQQSANIVLKEPCQPCIFHAIVSPGSRAVQEYMSTFASRVNGRLKTGKAMALHRKMYRLLRTDPTVDRVPKLRIERGTYLEVTNVSAALGL